jgi:hypothetical protein
MCTVVICAKAQQEGGDKCTSSENVRRKDLWLLGCERIMGTLDGLWSETV